MKPLYSLTQAIDQTTFTPSLGFAPARGRRLGRHIIAAVGLRLVGTVTTGTAGLLAADIPRMVQRVQVQDAAGLRRDLIGDDAFAYAQAMMGATYGSIGADLGASDDVDIDFQLMLPFYLPSLQEPSDFCMAVDDLLNGGMLQATFATPAQLPADAVTDLSGVNAQFVLYAFEEVGPVRLRMRDLVKTQTQSSGGGYRFPVNGNLLSSLFIRSVGTAGGTVLTNLTSLSSAELDLVTQTPANLRQMFRATGGVPAGFPTNSDLSPDGFTDLLGTNRIVPIYAEGFGGKLADAIRIEQEVNLTTVEASALSNVRLIGRTILPQSREVNAAAIQAQGPQFVQALKPSDIRADVSGRPPVSELGDAAAFLPKVIV